MVDHAGFVQHKTPLKSNGFVVIESIYSVNEVEKMVAAIETADLSNSRVRRSAEVFAIRQVLKEIPELQKFVFNDNLKALISQLFGQDYFSIKSIYFDKPHQSNWFVPYHQDLMISVNEKTELPGYGPWTVKQDQISVQPPVSVLERIYTIRIHLDATDINNGALKVIPGSHTKTIHRPETIDWTKETEITCNIDKGGVMIMRPLLLHSSGRTLNNQKRRVIHIEFSNEKLPGNLAWAEYLS